MTGAHWIDESGLVNGPIAITNTHSVGIVRDSMVDYLKQFHPESYWSLPIVGETYDGFLNDLDGFHVKKEHVSDAISNAKPGTSFILCTSAAHLPAACPFCIFCSFFFAINEYYAAQVLYRKAALVVAQG
jgi:hypothetical protein